MSANEIAGIIKPILSFIALGFALILISTRMKHIFFPILLAGYNCSLMNELIKIDDVPQVKNIKQAALCSLFV